jgi:hypothetical protein
VRHVGRALIRQERLVRYVPVDALLPFPAAIVLAVHVGPRFHVVRVGGEPVPHLDIAQRLLDHRLGVGVVPQRVYRVGLVLPGPGERSGRALPLQILQHVRVLVVVVGLAGLDTARVRRLGLLGHIVGLVLHSGEPEHLATVADHALVWVDLALTHLVALGREMGQVLGPHAGDVLARLAGQQLSHDGAPSTGS